MATANITREEASARSLVVSAQSYQVTVDLSGRNVADAERQFLSTTVARFGSAGGTTHLDLIAQEIREATLDGAPVDFSQYDGYRVALPELSEGDHEVSITAVCSYSHSGEGLHRFVDPVDQKVYLYTQFETADARRMYANFEQPDQKATFQLTVIAPAEWTVFTNAPSVDPTPEADGMGVFTHEPTQRVSTYITALVAGEFHVERRVLTSSAGEVPAAVACRQSLAQYLDAERIFTTTQRGFEVFESTFSTPYPFGTYDQIFVPEFNAGAMENAGCVTFRDEYLFRSRVTSREMDARDNTILHELAHMWFGDLVTMRWWDDLWLNESFAEWASHFANDEIARKYDTSANPWASFSNERKAWAYMQDQLSTTHPIAADMSDLEKVDQNFDGITYAKGASVLKLLVSVVGQEPFAKGVHQYFSKHAFGNTELSDLLVELEASSGRDLSWFTAQWLETAGVNTLVADFDVDDEGKFTSFDVLQSASDEYPTLRTHPLGIGVYRLTEDNELVRDSFVRVDVEGERTPVQELIGAARGDLVLLNDGDLTYAKIRLDEVSTKTLIDHFDALSDPLARAVAWTSFWEATRDAELSSRDYVQLVLSGLSSELDMAAVSTLLAQAGNAALALTAPELRDDLNATLIAGLARLLKEAAPASDKQVVVAKSLIASVRSGGVDLLRGWLAGEEIPQGLAIDTGMRWSIVSALAKLGAIGDEEIGAELDRDNTSAGAESAAGAAAALPDADSKAQAWALATEEPDVPNETHRAICMGFWRYGQDDVLAPYPAAYLDLLGKISRREGVWESRGYATIGTALRWLFPTSVITESLVATIDQWLRDHEPSEQVRRTVTERLDESRRALRAQERSRVTE